ncbi:2,3-bisphosphoglycerate-dependent phosphoglycerate mutase [Candidatus Endowatersipora endosymbiont of Watersipora subatra]|uniref:2,3-bisphosphoglycerate-dependent phosphoglycerate mutase n=1 Tax=Candidatus Endowatersipora endosymbiont of Watersipora subatra TaxID=3077946 RepID=UPI00312C7D1B
MSGTLVLVRHGQSEWNKRNLFTGWKDPDLTKRGVNEAIKAGRHLVKKNLSFDIAFTSTLIRAQRTCQIILDIMDQSYLKVIRNQALNERNYGDLAGLNKDEACAKWGGEQVHIWRRSYDKPPPGEEGESLKDTGARIWPYYICEILPRLLDHQKVLVVAHGNSLRSLIMILDRIDTQKITDLNLMTGIPIIYTLKANSKVDSKIILG